jgi:hypothetical protein
MLKSRTTPLPYASSLTVARGISVLRRPPTPDFSKPRLRERPLCIPHSAIPRDSIHPHAELSHAAGRRRRRHRVPRALRLRAPVHFLPHRRRRPCGPPRRPLRRRGWGRYRRTYQLLPQEISGHGPARAHLQESLPAAPPAAADARRVETGRQRQKG